MIPKPEQTFFKLIVEMVLVAKNNDEFIFYAAESKIKIIVRVTLDQNFNFLIQYNASGTDPIYHGIFFKFNNC